MGEITHVVKNNKRLCPTAISVANGMKETVSDNRRDQLFNEQSQKNRADSGQVEVVDQKERLELERFPIAHKLPSAEDDGVVDDYEDTGLFQRRHGGRARFEPEIVRRVPYNELKGLIEVGP